MRNNHKWFIKNHSISIFGIGNNNNYWFVEYKLMAVRKLNKIFVVSVVLVEVIVVFLLVFVEGVEFNQIVDTYPIYHKRYLKDFATVTQMVKDFSQNIHLLGRCGAFWYNNSDHAMRMAIELAQELTGDHEQPFNYRRYFG